MPRRPDLDSICLIGAGPIVIGQACEFDYSGSQALKVLREDGFTTIVVNSNPATIMTDPGFADRTYLEPLDLEGVAAVLERERPDALLPTMGGQTALNLAMELAESGILAELGVELIGARLDVIKRAEDRELFRDTVRSTGLKVPESTIVTSLDEVPEGLTFPVILRPAFTLGGHGGGTAYSEPELRRMLDRALRESPVGQVLVEESLLGWDEFELEVMRDRKDNVIIVCSIENLDPMGIHTGDSVTVAPQMTLADEEYQELRDAAASIVRAVGVETGGSNIQFARDRVTRRPARDRDEPARFALLGARLEGDRLPDREGRGQARGRLHAGRDPERPDRDDAGQLRADARLRRRQVPALRVREVPRRRLDARDADEVGRRGDGDRPQLPRGLPEDDALARARFGRGSAVARARGRPRGRPSMVPGRARPDHARSRRASARLDDLVADDWLRLKRLGISDADVAAACGSSEEAARAHRRACDVRPVYRRVDSCAGEVEAGSNYFYSAWGEQDEVGETGRSVVILGSGPEPDRPGDRVRLLLRPRRALLPGARARSGHGQLQSRDRLDRLRHVRPPLLRATRRGGGAGDLRARAAGGSGHPVRRTDAAQARARARACRLSHPRHAVRGDRPGRGPRALRRPARAAGHPLPGVGDRRGRGGGNLGRRARRLPRARAAFVRPRRARDACLLRAGRRPCRDGARDRPRPRRPLPRERGRDRRGRALRRRGHVRRRRHAARGGGGRPLRRLLVRPPAAFADRRLDGRDPRDRRRARAGARRRRPPERPARRRRRPRLRARGQPARLPHRPVREQGDRNQPRRGRLPPGSRRQAVRSGPVPGSDPGDVSVKAAVLPVRPLPRERSGARARRCARPAR